MSNIKAFKRLLEPLQIKQVRLRNRIVKPAQRMSYADKDGNVTQRALDFYESIAKGGVGMVIVEHAYVDFPLGVRGIQFSAADDKATSSLTELAKVIHEHGCPAIQQISHAGLQHDTKSSGLQPVGPSALSEDFFKGIFGRTYNVRPLTIGEIGGIVEKFALAAGRVRKAGFDGLEIHAAHDYLLACFLSRIWNKRDDEYGAQTLENRTRIVVSAMRAIREQVGQDFVVGVRINGAEYGAKVGITSNESTQIAKILESNGADYIHVMARGYGDFSDFPLLPILEDSERANPLLNKYDRQSISSGFAVPLAASIKKVINVPVIVGGRLDPVKGEWILRKDKADAISIGRRLLADPELPNKLAEGRLDDVAPCIACGNCLDCNARSKPVSCQVNPALGKERSSKIEAAERRKTVVVVGGGLAGMEAARVASLRGHEVILYEKEAILGGLLPLASMVKNLEIENLSALTKYFKTHITKLAVKIRLRQEYNVALTEKINPDVVIIAYGGAAKLPEIPGIGRRNVLTTEELYNRVKFFLRFLSPRAISRLTRFWLPIGKRVVIIGGLIQGCEAAEFLIQRGRSVTIVEETSELGVGIPEIPNRRRILQWLMKRGAKIFTEVKYDEITEKGLSITAKDGKCLTINAETILIATPRKANVELFHALKEKTREVYLIGDAKGTNLIGDAIADGFQTGRSI